MQEIGISDIKRVVEALNESSGIDFSNYAFSSFKRRIIRFFELNKIRDLNVFIERISTDRNFSDHFVEEITVNVTEMFRDPSFWVVLRDTVLPQINNKSEINIWHAACSTGEEVYSMAILLKESSLLRRSKIVATDLNSSVLKVAENGIFPLKSQETNARNYELYGGTGKLSDYYSVVDNTVQFDRQLISGVDFRCHNLAQDGPISKFDLVLCRNVLIYFNSNLQERVIQTFNNSMSGGSFLGIGSKESIRWCKGSNSFEEENSEEKIYRKIAEKKFHFHLTI